jgi:hypothetical protein
MPMRGTIGSGLRVVDVSDSVNRSEIGYSQTAGYAGGVAVGWYGLRRQLILRIGHHHFTLAGATMTMVAPGAKSGVQTLAAATTSGPNGLTRYNLRR